MSRFAWTTVLLVGLATPTLAQDFRAENRVTVRPGNGDFAVLGGGGQGARGMWCAASDYARDVLGARGVDRIYVKVPLTRELGARDAVVFSMSSEGLTPVQTLIVSSSIRQPGSNLSVDHAWIFCQDARLINR